MPSKTSFQEGARLGFLGQIYTLIIRTPEQNENDYKGHYPFSDRVMLDASYLVIETCHPSPITIERLTRTWLDQETERLFSERLNHCFERFQTTFGQELQARFPGTPLPHLKPRLVIRTFKARWGHMTRNRIMALNTQLIQVPLEAIDAVIFHELVHILHFNHQKPFHDCLEALVPHHKQVHKDLSQFWLARQKEIRSQKGWLAF